MNIKLHNRPPLHPGSERRYRRAQNQSAIKIWPPSMVFLSLRSVDGVIVTMFMIDPIPATTFWPL